MLRNQELAEQIFEMCTTSLDAIVYAMDYISKSKISQANEIFKDIEHLYSSILNIEDNLCSELLSLCVYRFGKI